MLRLLSVSLLAATVMSFLACSPDPLYCDENSRCTDPERPFCDLAGAYPASAGVARTCIPDPNADSGPGSGDGGISDAGGSASDGGASDGGDTPDSDIDCKARLAFQSYRDGDSEIYVSEADGSDQTNLTQDPGSDFSPRWSPNGARIAFVRDSRVWIMNSDGSDSVQLTFGPSEADPQWSPDGARIAFKRNDGGASNLWVVMASGGGSTQLTTAGASRFSWSPDGTKVVFSTERDGNLEIYTMNSDGSAETRRTYDSSEDDAPVWTPDGFEILFRSRRSGNDDLWMMGPIGNNVRNLSNTPEPERDPVFMPDGSKIVYQRGVNAAGQLTVGILESSLYRMNRDGSDQQQLTFEDGEDARPRMSSDGGQIAWTRNVGPTIDVYVGNADGTGNRPLTTTGVDSEAVWQPCP